MSPTTGRSPDGRSGDVLDVHPVRASLVRGVLLGGAEPSAVMIEVGVAGALLFGVGFHVATFALAAFWLGAVHNVMVWVAKADPQMTLLYLRSLAGRDYYAPHALVHGPAAAPRPSIPRTK